MCASDETEAVVAGLGNIDAAVGGIVRLITEVRIVGSDILATDEEKCAWQSDHVALLNLNPSADGSLPAGAWRSVVGVGEEPCECIDLRTRTEIALIAVEPCRVGISTTGSQVTEATTSATAAGAKAGVLQRTEAVLEPGGTDLSEPSFVKSPHILCDHGVLIVVGLPVQVRRSDVAGSGSDGVRVDASPCTGAVGIGIGKISDDDIGLSHHDGRNQQGQAHHQTEN